MAALLSPSRDNILFYVNGARVVVEAPDLDQTLLQYLRSAGLTGTKLGCGEGGCGACTVMVSRYDTAEQRIIHASVNACLCPLYTMDGKHVITVEGLGTAKNPHPVQERIALLHGSQCGFCTPGFVMSLYTLLRNNPNPSELEIEECFDGNLCRCTGYRPILDAAKTFAEDAWKPGSTVNADGSATAMPKKQGMGDGSCGIDGCCRLKPQPEPAQDGNADGCCGAKKASGGGCCRKDGREDSAVACDDQGEVSVNEAEREKAEVIAKFQKYDASRELIFPPFLIRYAKGNTAAIDSVGVEMRLKKAKFPVQVFVNDIPELQAISKCSEQVTFGANISLERFARVLDGLIKAHGPERTQSFAALRDNLRFFAGNQIRNVATIAGNIATASPISDLNPVFMAANATVILASAGAKYRRVPMSEFFLGYRRTAMQPSEVIYGVSVPFNVKGEVVRAFKQAKRRDDDIAIVTCGLRVRVDQSNKVTDASFAYGGMAPTTVLATKAMECAKDEVWGEPLLLNRMMQAVQEQLRLDFTVPGGMAEYRTTLAISFIYKFWALSCRALSIDCLEAAAADEMEDDAAERTLCKGKQEYASVTDRAIVGKGVAHLSALRQTTGEARYIDDMPTVTGELYMALVLSPHAHARIVAIDSESALAIAGVHRVLTAKDVPGSNCWNIFHDEEILPSEEVHYAGQPVALVLADNQRIAQEAARAVNVAYEALPAVLTVRDAVAQGSLFAEERVLRNGDVDSGLAKSDYVLSGDSYCGAQEHFYLETMASITVPKGEGDEFDIFSSTQNPTETQMVCAEVLGVPASQIVCHVKRMGGGFGGKESRSVLLAAFTTLGAFHTNRSVRIMLDRDEDMRTSGQRHPFLGRWTVGFSRAGQLQALRMQVFSNGGFSHDLSIGVLERAVSHVDNCYRIPATEIVGRVCRTNTQSNTAFRSFGGCQGMFLLESMLCEIADHLGKHVEEIRALNMYQANDITPFSQVLDDWNVPRMWEQLASSAQYAERRKAVDEFNSKSRFRKRGLAQLPTKFGISFGVKHLNQGMSLVHVYMDGSVLVAHGGTEMGQGLHTKMAQIAAETLGLPLSSIFISETATNTAANTSPTAASASSDLNGFAVYNACKTLADRLRPYREKMPNEPFSKIARTAYLDRCSLTAAGHYATPDIGFNWQKNEGLLYFYFTQGVAIAEVELDTLTGTHTTRRVDIMMDVGKSLNKALDIGQIEGAFAQGQGWTTSEEFLYFPNGPLFTQGPGNYKIPSALDIPRDFR
ncbi:hypothetical protein J3B02_001980, partial [Coemansia erecta]